jgi:hypothetical protein
MKLEVSVRVGDEIKRLCSLFGITEDKLLRQLLKLPDEARVSTVRQGPNDAKWFITRFGEKIRVGLKLKRVYKGKEWFAVVGADGIRIVGDESDRVFSSPSAPAKYITKFDANGWTWWTVEQNGEWVPLEKLGPDLIEK